MPLAVFILGLAIFAQGTSELMLAGLLPEMAADLGVSVPDAGLLISAFAIGMLVGAPVLAVVTLRWPRRTALLTFMLVFTLTHVAGALTSSYGLLFATRVAGAVVYAGFWAVAASTAIGLVPPNARGRAMSILVGGLTVATLLGLSLGTVIGQHLGWRAAFWAVAALSALAAVGVLATIPGGRPERENAPRITDELRSLLNPRLWLALATTSLATGALLVSFSYLSAMLVETTGMEAAWVPAILALYGVGATIGITIGGRTADTRPFPTLYAGIAGLVVTSALLALAAPVALLAVPLIVLLGAFGFFTNPTLNTRAFALAKDAPRWPPR
ncbi:Cmx/CmrA family chloramphenicol efflux MFS transporter [Nonomuraea sp. WAC 01424]|uniref:Cmx/CmrA family chloramphenicol efflux MFS transporter n=1 Tax=Nonomuraea sp. WAC 01424 TaxID=2203200 RepID=UPI001C8C2996|nr:Cmx/CmrA family chloramphenicol efflux MFS transporter [Nonomuraea sp. WAC 01424]